MRKACEDGKDPYIDSLEYINTPISGPKESPAQPKPPTVESLFQPQVAGNPRQKLQRGVRSNKCTMIAIIAKLPPNIRMIVCEFFTIRVYIANSSCGQFTVGVA